MKEYKVFGAKSLQKAEDKMNEMAQEGWEVIDTCYFYGLQVCVMVTFAREKQ